MSALLLLRCSQGWVAFLNLLETRQRGSMQRILQGGHRNTLCLCELSTTCRFKSFAFQHGPFKYKLSIPVSFALTPFCTDKSLRLHDGMHGCICLSHFATPSSSRRLASKTSFSYYGLVQAQRRRQRGLHDMLPMSYAFDEPLEVRLGYQHTYRSPSPGLAVQA